MSEQNLKPEPEPESQSLSVSEQVLEAFYLAIEAEEDLVEVGKRFRGEKSRSEQALRKIIFGNEL